MECNECMKWRGSRIDVKSGMSQLTGHVYSISIAEEEVPGANVELLQMGIGFRGVEVGGAMGIICFVRRE